MVTYEMSTFILNRRLNRSFPEDALNSVHIGFLDAHISVIMMLDA